VTFYNGLDFQLLPICQVTYKGKISEEISGMMSQGGARVCHDWWLEMSEHGIARFNVVKQWFRTGLTCLKLPEMRMYRS
jgi:hypothetical protein